MRSGPKIAATLVIIALLLLVSIFYVTSGGAIFHTSASSSASGVLPGCPSVSQEGSTVGGPTPNYDVQQVEIFTQTYSQLAVNVTAIAQCDTNGYGPSYLLNGLTNTGYWYQVGVDWNWPLQSGGYSAGFGFVSEAWAPGGFTRSSPYAAFSGVVNSGDTIELGLSVNGGQVIASAIDLDTGASGSMSYPARAATQFIGSQAQEAHPGFSFATQGYFTGLMTEWYHVSSSYGPSQAQVTYTTNMTISSATLAVGEWNFTGSTASTVFSDVANSDSPVTLSTQTQQFVLQGFTIAVSTNEFVTGA